MVQKPNSSPKYHLCQYCTWGLVWYRLARVTREALAELWIGLQYVEPT